MEGRFTFCTTRGRSVNDYLLLSPINYDKISAFEVKQFNEFSDHSPIFFELDFSNNRQPFEPPAVHSFIKWNNDKNHEYILKLLSNQNTLFSLVDDIASVDDMNSVVRNISDILYKYAFEVYGRSVLIREMLIQKGQIMNGLMKNVLQLDETFIVQETFSTTSQRCKPSFIHFCQKPV